MSDSRNFGQDSLSDGRKIFRLFKEFREVYKVSSLGFKRRQGASNPEAPGTTWLEPI